MKTRPVNQAAAGWLPVGTEEDGRGEYTLKCLHHAPVITTIFGELEEFEYLSGAVETDGPTFLSERERRHPDRDEAILAKGDGRFIMHLPQWCVGILCLFGV